MKPTHAEETTEDVAAGTTLEPRTMTENRMVVCRSAKESRGHLLGSWTEAPSMDEEALGQGGLATRPELVGEVATGLEASWTIVGSGNGAVTSPC
jgi:hypothetical protein